MTVEVRVPEMGESITEVYIGEWSKSEGESVDQDEPLVELESDKATLDLPAPAAGTLVKIIKRSGETAEVGEVIAEIGDRDGRPAAKKAKTPAGEQAAKQQAASATDSREDPLEAAAAKSSGPALLHEKRRKRREADERPARQSEAADVEPRRPPTAPKDDDEVREPSEPVAAKGEPEQATSRRDERVPMSPVRRRIAERLVESQRSAALLTTFNEIDMTAVKELRARCGEEFRRKHHVSLGYMSFFIKAVIDALEYCPELNAMIDEDDILYRRYYDIGVAVSSEKGLVVPVLRDAQRMSFAQIERAIDELAGRARDGRLKVEELQGGTFTITNGGVFGSLLSTPIVNPPQSGVLGMHAIQDRPVAVHGEVVIRPMMYVALTYDHRLIDGREAVTFLKRIKTTIEDPSRLVIGI